MSRLMSLALLISGLAAFAVASTAPAEAQDAYPSRTPVSSTPEELGKILTDTHEQVATTIQEFGLQID
jgi:hypothetical protein